MKKTVKAATVTTTRTEITLDQKDLIELLKLQKFSGPAIDFDSECRMDLYNVEGTIVISFTEYG